MSGAHNALEACFSQAIFFARHLREGQIAASGCQVTASGWQPAFN